VPIQINFVLDFKTYQIIQELSKKITKMRMI